MPVKRIIGIVTSGICLLVLIGVWLFLSQSNQPSKISLGQNAEYLELYDKALEDEARIKEKPTNPEPYLSAGLNWTSLGNRTNDQKWYERALFIYEKGMDAIPKNTLLISNAGRLAEYVNDVDKARRYYEKAIEISPGDASYYISLTTLMRSKLKSSEREILDVYNRGLDRIVGPAAIIVDRAGYFKSIGRYEESRQDLELLLKNNIITKEQYDSETSEMSRLEQK